GDSWVIFDGFNRGVSLRIIPKENKIVGAVRYHCGQVPDLYSSNYFVIVFDRPFTVHGVWNGGSLRTNETALDAKDGGAFVKFETGRNKVVGCRVASSFISLEQAVVSLDSEIGK